MGVGGIETDVHIVSPSEHAMRRINLSLFFYLSYISSLSISAEMAVLHRTGLGRRNVCILRGRQAEGWAP